MNSRSRILQLIGFSVALVATPLAAVRYQAAMRDPDIWWHLRVGEWILHGQGFPHTAVFSRLAQTNSWAAYSWIFEVVVAQLYHWFSLAALPIFLFVFQITIGAALLASAVAITNSCWRGALLTSTAIAACFFTLSPRPVLFTVLFFIVEMAMIFYDLRNRSIRALNWAPLLFLLWANCHIQFVDGLLVLSLLAASEFAQHFISQRVIGAAPELPFGRLLAIFAGCIVATLINPYGWHLYQVIWGYVHTGAQWNEIVELTAPSFRRFAHFIELLLALSAALALGAGRNRSVFRIALVAVSAMISFHASRDAWMISVVAVFICAEQMETNAASMESPRNSVLIIAISAALALILSIAAQTRVGLSSGALIAELDRMYPVRAASFVADRHPLGPLYNSVNWGGYLIYNLREYPVAADGRTDAYGGDVGQALRVEQGLAGWKQDPTFAASNVILIERNLPLARLLAEDPDFRMVYQDHLAMVFVGIRR
jgi:hypothetical protein